MPDFRLRDLWPVCLCCCAFSVGCASTDSSGKKSSFTSVGAGEYGQNAEDPGATKTVYTWNIWSDKREPAKINDKTKLAYAQYEESRGNQAATRKFLDEQRAAHAASRKAYHEVLEKDSKSVDAVIGLARLDQVAGRLQDAEQGFQKAVRLENGSARSLDALGQFYAEQSRWNDALPVLSKAMQLVPEDPNVRFHYAIALAKSGQIDTARPYLNEAVGVAVAHYNIGVILYEKGQVDAAEEEFVAAILENPRLEKAQEWLQDLRAERSEGGQVANASAARRSPSRRRSPGAIVQASATMPAKESIHSNAPAQPPAILPTGVESPATTSPGALPVAPTSAAPSTVDFEIMETSPADLPQGLNPRPQAPVAPPASGPVTTALPEQGR